jgi:hypothetical protein
MFKALANDLSWIILYVVEYKTRRDIYTQSSVLFPYRAEYLKENYSLLPL